jgi:hypothetical protein
VNGALKRKKVALQGWFAGCSWLFSSEAAAGRKLKTGPLGFKVLKNRLVLDTGIVNNAFLTKKWSKTCYFLQIALQIARTLPIQPI